MICRPRIFLSFIDAPLFPNTSPPHLNPKIEPLTQRAAHGGRYTVQRGRST